MYRDIHLYKEKDSSAPVPFKSTWSRCIAKYLNSLSKNLNSDGLGYMKKKLSLDNFFFMRDSVLLLPIFSCLFFVSSLHMNNKLLADLGLCHQFGWGRTNHGTNSLSKSAPPQIWEKGVKERDKRKRQRKWVRPQLSFGNENGFNNNKIILYEQQITKD